MAEQFDPYAVLQVSRDASADDIRRCYRKLAKQNHPDVNPGDKAAEERFKQASAAYDILSDAKKRALYDEFGSMGLREGFDPSQARAYQRYTQAGSGGFSGEGDLGFGDIFGDFFAGGPRGRSRGSDLAATVEISLAESIRGSEVTLQMPASAPCGVCRGAGQAPDAQRTCGDCDGTGKVAAVRGPLNLRTRCPHCNGTGRRGPTCGACGGTGRSSQRDSVTVRIPKGADHGSKLRVPGRGATGPAGTGDLILETRIRPHPYFRREGLDLHLRLPVTVEEAYVGTTIEVPDATGTVNLRIPPRSQQGARLRLKERGVSRGAQRGHLYVELDVRLPEGDDADQQTALLEALKTVSAAYTKPVRQDVHL